jgi:hypothetical protein
MKISNLLKKYEKSLKSKYRFCFIGMAVFIVVIGLVYLTLFAQHTERKEVVIIRQPAVSGSFYPSNREELSGMINSYLKNANPREISKVRGLVEPHAGYIFSGPTVAYGYKEIEGGDYKIVIMIGPSHHVRFEGVSIPNATHYKTPLGLVKVSEKAKELLKEDLISNVAKVHEKEHSIEVQIPFLQTVLEDFEIVPIVTGNADPEKLANILIKYIDDKTLIIASSDLSHYYPYEEARSLDSFCINSIPNLDFKGMQNCEACGKIPILTLMYIANKLGWSGETLDYRNSGDTAGSKERVVGYTSIAFFEGLSKNEQEFLLSLARKTLDSYLLNGTRPTVDENELTPNLRKIQGCFVTLNKFGNLRGCIGHILPQEELYKCVIDNAISAALYDKRFKPVEYNELKDIEIEISVLSVPKILEHDSPEDLLNKLRPGIDGVVLKSGIHQSTYLPQVWEQLPDKEEFLSRLCLKGELSQNCWKDPNTEVLTYQAFVFHEK